MFINHPRYAQITTYTQSLCSAFDAKQSQWFAANNEYFQGISLTDLNPDGVTDVSADTTKHPTDHASSWRDFDPTIFTSNLSIPYNLRCDVYQSSLGWGYILTIEIWYSGIGPDAYSHDGNHWVYRHHVGPLQQSGIIDEWHIIPTGDF